MIFNKLIINLDIKRGDTCRPCRERKSFNRIKRFRDVKRLLLRQIHFFLGVV